MLFRCKLKHPFRFQIKPIRAKSLAIFFQFD
jgi:hypothetical protein